MKHVIEAQQFNITELEQLFTNATLLETEVPNIMNSKILATIFYEPSTRTRLSFESAMIKLGGSIISTENAREFSSAIKGETLEDTVKIISCYADCIALRHYETGAATRASAVSGVPIINAGDGAGQHPTQALLDLYTILRETGKISGTKIVMLGDLKHGRTVHSLCYLLGKYSDIHIDFVSPKNLRLDDKIKEYLEYQNISFTENESFVEVLDTADVVYQTRIQKERFVNQNEYEQNRGSCILNVANTNNMKTGAVILHPLPRVDEISPELDLLPKAAYFRQAKYGLLIRMALLQQILT